MSNATVATRPDHSFHRVTVSEVVVETHEARSFVLQVPSDLRPKFEYLAGQFCTFRVAIDGATLLRCYSMSSAPGVDDAPAVTVKRVPGGAVSNWLIDHVEPGSELDVTLPAGRFVLTETDADLVAFAAGSGITPIMSLARAALANTDRRVRVLYANRDPDNTIFLRELDRLASASNGRLSVTHRWDIDHGFTDAAAVDAFLRDTAPSAEHYVCGPPAFMDIVESTLLAAGVDGDRIHVERFATPPGNDGADAADIDAEQECPTSIVIDVDGRVGKADHRPGTTILQTARQLGLDPPYSCESGSCATCMARLLDGSVEMLVNDALTDEEVADGFVLTCQSVPTSPTVHVVYGFD
ncbi:MAG TPA: ferredoxin--NADP reductase [Microthrixaceae bacterium]|nr:ferredoxin--NADP reductase [Microthrixaceae bacterium]HNI34529.1 ferredoxin--NADP reductase [Microthrixaceae bacterium]